MNCLYKTSEEMARLDAIWAEIEAAERSEPLQKEECRTPAQVSEDNRMAKIERLAKLDCTEFMGNIKSIAGNNGFKTKWEQILSKFIIDTIGPMRAELNALRQFANAVDNDLTHCARLAREQDNHHHYKVFADRVAKLLEKI